MKLAEWLRVRQITRGAFARQIGVTPGAITQICNQSDAWVSRDTAEAIVRATARSRPTICFPVCPPRSRLAERISCRASSP